MRPLAPFTLWGANPGNLVAEYPDLSAAFRAIGHLLTEGWDPADLRLEDATGETVDWRAALPSRMAPDQMARRLLEGR